MEKIGDILIELGYPPCKGNIMVTNPFWRDSLSGYKNKISNWLSGSDEESYIHFATFFDAVSVSGNGKLLNELKDYVFNETKNDSIYLAYFARLSLLFDTPVGLLSSILRRDRFIEYFVLKPFSERR